MDLEYEQLGESLDSRRFVKVIRTINRSRKVELAELPDGRLNHIVIKDTTIPIGYLGANNQIEKVNPNDKSLKPYHDFLEGIYRIICPYYSIVH